MSVPPDDPDAREQRRLRHRALVGRLNFRKGPFGPLAQSYMAAMEICDQMKADGLSADERYAALEKTLRAAWPTTRAWHYLCEICNDTGWKPLPCPAIPCQRKNPHGPHDYVVPCLCAKGRMRIPVERKPESELAKIGKTKGAFTKVGR